MVDQPPIIEPHEAFARALVALAREHNVGFFQGQFRLSTGMMTKPSVAWHSGNVTIAWVEGRHGIAGQIELRAELSTSIQEIIS